MGVFSRILTKKQIQNRLAMNRQGFSLARYRNSAKISDPAISTKMNGKKYGPVGNSSAPRVSVTAAQNRLSTGPITVAPRALMMKAVLIRKLGPMGMLICLKMMRSATIMAANTIIRVLLNSLAARRQ